MTNTATFKEFVSEASDMSYLDLTNHINKIELLLRDIGFMKYIRNLDKNLGTKLVNKVDKITDSVTSITDDIDKINLERMV